MRATSVAHDYGSEMSTTTPGRTSSNSRSIRPASGVRSFSRLDPTASTSHHQGACLDVLLGRKLPVYGDQSVELRFGTFQERPVPQSGPLHVFYGSDRVPA